MLLRRAHAMQRAQAASSTWSSVVRTVGALAPAFAHVLAGPREQVGGFLERSAVHRSRRGLLRKAVFTPLPAQPRQARAISPRTHVACRAVVPVKHLLGKRMRARIEMGSTRPVLLEVGLPAAPEAAELARAAIDRLSTPGRHGERFFDLRLLASELVANAVQHGVGAEGRIRLSIAEVAEQRLRVEVEDDGPGFTEIPVRPASHHQTSGRGLRLLSALADRWGIERTPQTRVWFELDLAAPRRTHRVNASSRRLDPATPHRDAPG